MEKSVEQKNPVKLEKQLNGKIVKWKKLVKQKKWLNGKID